MESCHVSRTPVLSEKVTEVDFKFFLLLRVCVFQRTPVSRSLGSKPSNDCRHDTTSQRTRKSGSTQTRRLADYGCCVPESIVHYVMHTHEGCVDFKPGLRNLGAWGAREKCGKAA